MSAPTIAPRRRAAAPLRRLVTAALLLMACGGGGGDTPSEPGRQHPATPSYGSLWIAQPGVPPAISTLSVEEGEYTTVGLYGIRTGAANADTVVATWTTTDSTVVRVQSMGAVLGEPSAIVSIVPWGAGQGQVVAHVGGRDVALNLNVRAARPAFIHVTSPDPVVPATENGVIVGTTRRFAAEVLGPRLTHPKATVVWSTSDTAVAVVTADGVLTGRRVGTVTLWAAADTVWAKVPVVVRPPLAARIAFERAPDTLLVRHDADVVAVLYDSAGRAMSIAPTVQTSDPSLAFYGSGRIHAFAAGKIEVVATGDGLTARHAVTLVPVPLGTLATLPDGPLSLAVGRSAAVATRATDVDGQPATTTVAYTVDDAGVATVSDRGVVTAVSAGHTAVHATSGAVRRDVPVDVYAAGRFAIEIRAVTPLAPGVADALDAAAASWSRVILNDLPDIRLTLPDSVCDANTPKGPLAIDDVLILVRGDSIDGKGGVLAEAGPCIVRTDGTPAVGSLIVDSADVSLALSRGLLVDVLRHEMGHVLGIGTLWDDPDRALVRKVGSAYRFVGARGRATATWWSLVTSDGVALGEAGGFEGSGHWAEGTFGNELMTPVINSSGGNPLSLLTIQALNDLGYTASAAAAESYAGYPASPLTSRAPAVGTGGVPLTHFERLVRPRWRLTHAGRLERAPR